MIVSNEGFGYVVGSVENPINDVDPAKNGNGIHVAIGNVIIGEPPDVFVVILGSCIALALYDPKSRIGGMTHILLRGDEGGNKRYSGPATRELISKLRVRVGQDAALVAKIAGGSSNPLSIDSPVFRNLGKQTMLHVVSILVDEGIDIFGMHVGGYEGRNIFFKLEDGSLWIKTKKGIAVI
ncbi:hypothetical protein DRQ05_00775 [bacterium]|nr:MAG: hypothetical protein DRQ05_00775 [bacterium]